MASQRKRQSFQEKVWRIARTIPAGKVVSYKALARVLGSQSLARAVGNALNRNPYRNVPCHRVVRSDGKVGGFARGTVEKTKLLRQEGVRIIGERVEPSYVIRVFKS